MICQSLRNAMIEHLKQRTEGYAVQYRIKHHSGHWVWIEDRGRAIERDKSGRVLRMLGTRRDISHGKNAMRNCVWRLVFLMRGLKELLF